MLAHAVVSCCYGKPATFTETYASPAIFLQPRGACILDVERLADAGLAAVAALPVESGRRMGMLAKYGFVELCREDIICKTHAHTHTCRQVGGKLCETTLHVYELGVVSPHPKYLSISGAVCFKMCLFRASAMLPWRPCRLTVTLRVVRRFRDDTVFCWCGCVKGAT